VNTVGHKNPQSYRSLLKPWFSIQTRNSESEGEVASMNTLMQAKKEWEKTQQREFKFKGGQFVLVFSPLNRIH
jgi:hypothetical protein